MKSLLIDGGILFIALVWQIFIQSIILSILFNLNFSIKERILYTSILSTYGVFFRLLVPISFSFLNPLLSLLLTVYLIRLFNKNVSFLKAFICTLLIMLLGIPIEALSGMIGFQILNLPTNVENVVATIPVLLIINILHTLIAVFLFLFKKRKDFSMYFEKKSIGINIFLAFIFIAPNIMFYTVNKYNYPIGLLIYNIISNILLVILTVYNTYKNVKLVTTEIDLQNSEMHNKALKELNDSVRVFKHDYNNIVHAIGGYISTNDMNGLEKYYNGLAKDSNKVNQLATISPDVINEPSVYGIIAAKYQMAQSRHVELNVESMFNYKDLDMPIYDFCKILGILLDNAIEAAEETDEKCVNMRIRQSQKTMMQLFIIENTYLNKNINTEKIFEKDYSTKNRNSGIGLWEVKNIVDRNENVTLVTSKDKHFFKQELYIQIRESHNTKRIREGN